MALPLQTHGNILKVIFYPYFATSHIIPMVEMARAFAMNGVDCTIITTVGNSTIFQKSIDRDNKRGHSIKTHVLEFPAKQVGLPVGIETFNANTPQEMYPKIGEGIAILQPKIEKLFDELEADCIVSDIFHTWTVDAAAKLGIPRILLYPGSTLSGSAEYSLDRYPIYNELESDTEKFTIEGLPHQLEMTRLQVPLSLTKPDSYGSSVGKSIIDSTRRSYGTVFNSVYEWEGAFEEHYKNAYGTKCWSVGPLSLWVNKDTSDKVERGHSKPEEEEEEGRIMKWLNSKKENSVLYVSFGSLNKFHSSQLLEIAHALESSGHDFIWVVRKSNDEEAGNDTMEEFEKRMRESNKGYLIWGWAPQLLILENKAIGAMVTQCGWNTVNETMIVGLPMVTWPVFADHFFNEMALVDVLKVGVRVGAKKLRGMDDESKDDEVVKSEEIRRAISLVMGGGDEAVQMRIRAKKLSHVAHKAINVGGSSHNSMIQLIQDLLSLKLQRLNNAN